MAKYSTGRSGAGGDGDACELCGTESPDLRQANVAGASLLVCPDCAPHGSSKNEGKSKGGSDSESRGESRKKEVARKTARMMDAGKGDSTHWEKEGTNYEKDRLPYLVSGYGERAESARQDAGLTVEELATELDVEEDDVLAVEQGRASRAGVGGSVVRALEERLDVQLVE